MDGLAQPVDARHFPLPNVVPPGHAVSNKAADIGHQGDEGGGFMTETAAHVRAQVRAQVRQARNAALSDLDGRWGQAYDLAVTGAGWVAMRLDNGRFLVAASPDGLRALIRADDAGDRVRGLTADSAMRCHDRPPSDSAGRVS